jgi:serralysin
LSATYTAPVSSIDSIGLSPDGQYLLIKVDGVTQSVPVGSSLSFNGTTVTTSDLTSSITAQPVFQSSGGSNGYALPEVFTGPASLNLDYQLIENGYNAVVIGGATNDFIKVASTDSLGKAVDAGAGDDVIDGGVGSTFITGGAGSDTIFLDGRAPGVSWSTVTDFTFGQDKATIWGWKAGVSKVSTLFTDFNTGGAAGYTGLTLHFENLLPDGASAGQTNSNFNSITLSGRTLADFGASSIEDLNAQITAGTNSHFIVGQTVDAFGEHGYLFLS